MRKKRVPKDLKVSRRQMLDSIKKMRLMDNSLMTAVFDGYNQGAQDVLRIVMDNDSLTVTSCRTQAHIKNLQGHSIYMDIWAIDKEGKVYNVEVQRSDYGAGYKRARHNLSILDANLLPPGVDPQELPEVYVVFWTENDVVGESLPIYHIDRIIQETGKKFDDGEHIIYVNGAYQNEDTPLGVLISDFRQTDPNKVRTKSLSDRMRHFKESKEGKNCMCRVIEKLYASERLARARLFREKYPDSSDDMVLIATGITKEELEQLNEENQK